MYTSINSKNWLKIRFVLKKIKNIFNEYYNKHISKFYEFLVLLKNACDICIQAYTTITVKVCSFLKPIPAKYINLSNSFFFYWNTSYWNQNLIQHKILVYRIEFKRWSMIFLYSNVTTLIKCFILKLRYNEFFSQKILQ